MDVTGVHLLDMLLKDAVCLRIYHSMCKQSDFAHENPTSGVVCLVMAMLMTDNGIVACYLELSIDPYIHSNWGFAEQNKILWWHTVYTLPWNEILLILLWLDIGSPSCPLGANISKFDSKYKQVLYAKFFENGVYQCWQICSGPTVLTSYVA